MANDASYADVSLLLHGDGVNGSTTFIDNSPATRTVTAYGNAQISTAQSKFGGASMLFDGSEDYLSVPDSADWDFGTGDFTVEIWVRFTSHASVMTLICNYLNSSVGWSLQRRNDTNTIRFGSGDGALLDVSWTPTDGVWYHLAISRNGTALRAFVDGTQVGSTVTNSTNITGSTNPLLVGALFAGSYLQFFAGHLEDLRITKGVARYTADFTAPTRAHPDGLGEIEGVVRDDTNTPCSRTVRAYRRDTGALVGSTVSDATLGTYRIGCPTLDEVYRIVLDDSGGTLYNDLIDRVIPA